MMRRVLGVVLVVLAATFLPPPAARKCLTCETLPVCQDPTHCCMVNGCGACYLGPCPPAS
jgi:hypothetical protein